MVVHTFGSSRAARGVVPASPVSGSPCLIDLVRHVRVRLVAPGGRLLLSVYRSAGGTGPDAPTRLAAAGVRVDGSSGAGGALWTATTAWADVP
ncbi:hypothetical protein [Actinacidiphila yanglinensis]|uniref:hypothetical protein n=1 Tax=Actinacidiphila yanglinensis TaxID=310779 RepID=UPI0011B064B3|nr:hypothetical protein [Actinacidiphila yanglinensis]